MAGHGEGGSRERKAMSGSSEVQQAKLQLRQLLRSEDARHGAEERKEQSQRITDRLMTQEVWKRAQFVLAYAPMPSEPDISPLFQASLCAGKRLAFPRSLGLDAGYEAAEVKDCRVELLPGKFGILEPIELCPVAPRNQLDLVLIPGLGFDQALGRLGRGRGYYDRLLMGLKGQFCGVAFDWQVTVALPLEPHDIPVDLLVTPSRWLERARVQ